MNKIVTWMLGVLLISVVQQSVAATISCNGTPTELAIWTNNNSWLGVYFEEFEGPWVICDMAADSGGISQANCQAIYSALLSSMATGQEMKIKVNSDDYSACEDVVAWDTALPGSIQRVHLVR